MPEPMPCMSWSSFLVSISPALSALLSAIGLWVASRARSTSKAAQQTSQAALRSSQQPYGGPHVVVTPELREALLRHSSTTPAPGDTST